MSDKIKLRKKSRPPQQKKLDHKELQAEIHPKIFTRLPKKMPYKIGTSNELLFDLLSEYPDQKSALRKAIKSIMHRHCNSYIYYQATLNADCRHGMDGEEYPLDPAHRKRCKKLCHEIRQDRAKYLKSIKKKHRKRKAA